MRKTYNGLKIEISVLEKADVFLGDSGETYFSDDTDDMGRDIWN